MKPTHRVLFIGVVLTLAASTRPPLPLRASESFRVATRRAAPLEVAAQRLEGQVIVQFRAEVDDVEASRSMRTAGARTARRGQTRGRYLMHLDDGFTVAEALARLRSTPGVDIAEANHLAHTFLRPNDRLYGSQWHMTMINAERTWDIQKGDSSVVVAVIDTGIAYEDFGPYRKAPDFGSTVFVPGFDFVNNDTHANDDNFHGTHVASTIAESTNNSEGVAGLAFGCALMPVKVLDEEGTGTYFDIAEGIDFAARNSQVKVINLSLGGEEPSSIVERAVNAAVAKGITVVAAAGNDNEGRISFPAALPNVIAVGAVDGRKSRASYSNFGAQLDVVAPGGDTDRDDTGLDGRPDRRPDGVLQQTFDPDTAAETGRYDDFAYFFVDGTSQAAPHVAAVAALLYHQGITDPAAIQAAIQQSAEDLGAAGRDDQFGHGLIRPAVALSGLGLNRQ
jgi:serine protease